MGLLVLRSDRQKKNKSGNMIATVELIESFFVFVTFWTLTTFGDPPMSDDQIADAKTFGLSDEEIGYLRRPLRAILYCERYGISKHAMEKMINSGQLRAVLCKEILWVQNALPQDAAGETTGLMSAQNFLNNLWQGNLGLAMTYWVYGVLGGLVWLVGIIALDPQRETNSESFVLFSLIAYYFVVYVGIWRAASKYKGNRLWEILAKFVVIITVLPTVIKNYSLICC